MPSINLVSEIPGPKSKILMERRVKAVPKGPFHVTPLFVEKAVGALIHDVDGNTFLDFASGIGVTNSGHNNPLIIENVKKQLDKYLHTGFNVVPYEPYVELAEQLNRLAPGKANKKTFLANSGAEAVENAIKFARSYTKKQAIICFDHAYHGRTYMAMSLTAKSVPYKYGFAPFNSEVYRSPFPYLYRSSDSDIHNADKCEKLCHSELCLCKSSFEAFKQTVESQIGHDQVAGVIIEPVTGEGGFMPVPKAFMKLLEQYCKENDIVLIMDEIQTGFGRTGKLFATEHFDVEPDLLILAKGLAGGMPLSAVTGRADILESVGVGGVGGTYCGNPVSCVAALSALEQFTQSDALEHCNELGKVLQKRLDIWANKFSFIGDHRGLGPMRAVELVKDKKTKEPYKAAVGKIIKYAYENGVICIGAGTFGNVLRFLIPLTASVDQLQEGLDVVEAGLKTIH